MKKLFIILFFSTVSLNIYSTHLMGGEITYTCIKSGPNEGFYVFNVVIYRDCGGIPIDTSTFLNVHNNPLLQTITLNYIESNDISPSCNTLDGNNIMYSCGGSNQASAGNGIGAVEEHVYRSDTIRILGAPDQDGWHFTWSDCCRNGAIINITNPNNYGFTLRTAMYPYTDSSGVVWPNNNNCFDNSPVFYEKPRTIIETYNGYDSLSIFNGFTYSHNAYDAELDSISYEFAPPLDETGYDYLNPNATSIPFSAPYSYTMPINAITMNQNSGRTSYPANLQGNFVTCTKVSSFRCGQLISEVFREIQVVVTSPICNLGDTTNGNIGADTLCNVRPNVQAPFYYPNLTPQYQWDTMIHCGDTVSFDFIANDYDFYPNGSRQDLLFEVSGGQFYDYNNNQPCLNPPCATFEDISTGNTPPFISSGGQGGGEFNWITDCNQLTNGCNVQGPSIYSFVIKVSDDFCPAPAIENTSQVISILVFPPCNNLKTGLSTINATCNINDGIANSIPFGGTPPYTKYWTDINGINVNPDSLYVGTYLLRVIDSTLCETIDTFNINGPVLLNLNSNTTNVSCNGGSDGSIDISSNSVLFYNWNTGDTTQDLYNLNSGTYTLIVIDAFGCSTNQSFVISEPNLLTLQSLISDASCYGFNDAYIDISTNGGFLPFQYLWNTGDTSQSILNIGVGTYTLSVIDQNNCIITDSFQISQPNILVNNIISSSVTCNGLSDGNITTNQTGGTPPYSFLWNTNNTTQSLSSIVAGIYTVTVFDSNNCSLIDSVLIMQPDSLVSNILLDTTNFTASVFGGTSPYIYEFYGPTGFILSSTNASGGPISVNLNNPGYYSFVVIDANNCTDSVSVYYGNNFSPTIDVTLSNVYCDSLSSLTITVSQDSSEVDMSTALFQSNAGYFNIASLSIGDTIGTAYLMAAGGNISINTFLVVSSIISIDQAIITPCSWANGCLGSFAITNSPNGGIEIFSQTVPDGNNYTQGNMNSITFDNLFVNPCVPLVFTSTINSELGDIDLQSIVFNPTSIEELNINELLVYPNPSSDVFNIVFNSNTKQDIDLRIYSIIGKEIFHETLTEFSGDYNRIIDMSSYSNAIYILQLSTTYGISTKKLILEK